MAQFARPDSNVTQSGFTGGFAEIDEASASDADFAYGADNTAAELEVGLSNVTDPASSSGHIARVRIAKVDGGVYPGTGGNSLTMTGRLMQGTTEIAVLFSAVTAPDAWTTQSYTLSASEADAITDYTDLRIEVVTTASGGSPANRRGGAVSWAELEVPDPAAAITGDGAISAPTVAVSGTGAEIFTGTGAISVPAATVAGSGNEAMVGTGAPAVPAVTVVGSGWAEITGTGAIAVPPPTAAGSGIEAILGTGAIVGRPPLVVGTQSNDVEGTGAIVIAAPAVTGAGAEAMIATGAIVMPSPAVAGAGIEAMLGTGAVVGRSPTVAGAGWAGITGGGALVVPAARVQGTGIGGEAAAGANVYRRHLLLSR